MTSLGQSLVEEEAIRTKRQSRLSKSHRGTRAEKEPPNPTPKRARRPRMATAAEAKAETARAVVKLSQSKER